LGAIRKVISVGGRVQRQAVKGNDPHVKLLCCLMWLSEDGTDRVFRNVGIQNYVSSFTQNVGDV
jgi:hypothetical protein